MTGRQLKEWCEQMGGEKGCSVCPANKQCTKWKEMKKKLTDMEPWQMVEIEKLSKWLVDGYDFKFGREI